METTMTRVKLLRVNVYTLDAYVSETLLSSV